MADCQPTTTPDKFDAFWAETLRKWKQLPIKERNFLKRIGLEPNAETSRAAFLALKSLPAIQYELFTIIPNISSEPIETKTQHPS